MFIYAVIVTLIAILALIKWLQWKASTYAITMFCVERGIEPTEKEISDYTKKVIAETMKDLFHRR